jgi:hypothetical protein
LSELTDMEAAAGDCRDKEPTAADDESALRRTFNSSRIHSFRAHRKSLQTPLAHRVIDVARRDGCGQPIRSQRIAAADRSRPLRAFHSCCNCLLTIQLVQVQYCIVLLPLTLVFDEVRYGTR